MEEHGRGCNVDLTQVLILDLDLALGLNSQF